MLNIALNERTLCEDFDLEKEVLFFKIGTEGLVSFHGKNYSRRVKLSHQEIKMLRKNREYFRISSNCYINLAKIKMIAQGTIYFGAEFNGDKMLPINRRKQMMIEQLFTEKKSLNSI